MVPKNLNEALAYLTCIWPEKDREDFKTQPEEQAITHFHFGAGTAIRNEWGLWKGKNALVRYFRSIGIFSPEDMSSIILTSFHRQLNGKELNLKAQVKYYTDYWKKIMEENQEHNKIYTLIQKGDTVSVSFSKDKVQDDSYHLQPFYYNYFRSDTTNCIVKGVVTKKRRKKYLRILTIRITGTGNCYNSFLGQTPVMARQKFEYDVTHNIVTRN